MKDILITGGAGKIGYELINALLDSKYSITVLDLPSQESKQKLEKVSQKIKIIYGDVEDYNLILDLVRKNDIIIDYAGIMPPLADLNEQLTNGTNFLGCKNIVDAINKVNPNCIYIYPSFISIYGLTNSNKRVLSVKKGGNNPDDFYSVSLIRSENYIKENVKNYIILRMPIVLTKFNYYIKYMKLNHLIDFITIDNFNSIVIQILENSKLYGKTFNISGFKANSTVFLRNMYKYTGRLHLSHRRLYYGEYGDDELINKYIDIEYDNMHDFFLSIKHPNYLKKVINYPKYLVLKRKEKKLKDED